MARRGRFDRGAAAGAATFIVIGLGMWAFGAWQILATRDFVTSALPVQAMVIHNPADCDEDGCTWWPILRFTDSMGDTHEAKTRFGSGGYDWPEGAVVEVLRNPGYAHVRVPGRGNLWGVGLTLMCFGLVFAGMGALFYFIAVLPGE